MALAQVAHPWAPQHSPEGEREGEGEINLSHTPPWVQSQESATVYHLLKGKRDYWQLFLCTWSGRGFLGPLLPVGSWGSMIFTLIPSTPEEKCIDL